MQPSWHVHVHVRWNVLERISRIQMKCPFWRD
jgi:hypothetical protein